jgi:3-oxoacyl-[acyl-carrier protein] reductase
VDLGLAGRTAIVCASSGHLGGACARALSEAGCAVVINGRDVEKLNAVAKEIRASTGAAVTAVAADITQSEGQAALFRACPEPDILVNNNAGPPHRDFLELTRQEMIDGIIGNMIAAIELIQMAVKPMIRRRYGRIVNITSATVKMPQAGLDLSSGARAGLTAFLAGVARSVAHYNVTINQLLPGAFDTARLQESISADARKDGFTAEEIMTRRLTNISARRFGDPPEFGAACDVLALRESRIYNRPKSADRRRRVSGCVVGVPRPFVTRTTNSDCTALYPGCKFTFQSSPGRSVPRA